jgi:hypothetical protein
VDTPNPLTVFLSHSHRDKAAARRLARQLGAHGFRVWLDERELQVGAALGATLRGHIEAADLVVVVATSASARSAWVAMELDHARAHGRPIVPFLVDRVADAEPFRDHLGIEVASPQDFGAAARRLIEGAARAFDRAMPPPDARALEAGLRAVAAEERALEPLVLGCLDGAGLHTGVADGAYAAAFHPLDYALDALYALRPNREYATIAAYGFARAGAGVEALRQWVASSGDGGTPLAVALDATLDPVLIPSAIELLQRCDPPNNQALYGFIDRNADRLDSAQRRAVLRLVTWPVRGPERFGDVLGAVALRHFPDAAELTAMWARWIGDGQFDGDPMKPSALAHELAMVRREGLRGWEPVEDALRRHVRDLLRRAPDATKVTAALDHLCANADAGNAVAAAIVDEMTGISGTAEWDRWREEDREAAEEMACHVTAHVTQALGARDWEEALREAERCHEIDTQLRARRARGREG